MPDPRDPHCVWHALVVVLALTACAVLAGATSLLAVGECASNSSVRQRWVSAGWGKVAAPPDAVSPVSPGVGVWMGGAGGKWEGCRGLNRVVLH
ncbi:transposase family protein [Saccharopolyspora pogona]|uniref:transposase family protein n=1 Tax=Saccharopolyspora pogona TaxID=333966 RepID=UPI0037C8DF31